jgi:hypothetical protein
MTTGELRERFGAIFGEPTRSRNKSYLVKKIACRIQEATSESVPEEVGKQPGRLSEKTPDRPNASKARSRSTRMVTARSADRPRDLRLSPVGTVLKREFRGRTLQVKVGESEFEFGGRTYRSLSAIAREVAGTAWNGFLFFELIPLKRSEA